MSLGDIVQGEESPTTMIQPKDGEIFYSNATIIQPKDGESLFSALHKFYKFNKKLNDPTNNGIITNTLKKLEGVYNVLIEASSYFQNIGDGINVEALAEQNDKKGNEAFRHLEGTLSVAHEVLIDAQKSELYKHPEAFKEHIFRLENPHKYTNLQIAESIASAKTVLGNFIKQYS
ncbi:MAG: hypothetical protein KAQ83_03680 [Nanoarchaeota archaeon]|nr:hypothetical protein [Nanoarchaeota archaeon]